MRFNLRRRRTSSSCLQCGGKLNDDDTGYTGWLVYHRPCARHVYGALFIESEAIA